MSNEDKLTTDLDALVVYEIRVSGHLGYQWAEWFDGLRITLDENGDTALTGPVADQAALYGLLKKVRDLGMPLVSVNRVESGRTGMPDAKLDSTMCAANGECGDENK